MATENYLVMDREEFRKSMENGIYPHMTTSRDQYVNPESVDHLIYTGLRDLLENKSGEFTVLDIGSSSGEPLDEVAKKLQEEIECNSTELVQSNLSDHLMVVADIEI
ncbi:MAG: hypothetical protein ABEJ56_00935 [Candidatus Nanohaloarchaea archaeon]